MIKMNSWYDKIIKKCPDGSYNCINCFVSYKCEDIDKKGDKT